MTYTPNIPNAPDNISDSQSQIKTNFQQLNTIFGQDHYAFDDATASKRGFHKQITFPAPLAVDPPTSTSRGSFYTKADVNDTPNARPQLYYQNTNGANNVRQITNRFINSTDNNGWLMLPNGTTSNKSIIIIWGNDIQTFNHANHIYTVLFPKISNLLYPGPSVRGFPNACFQVQVSLQVGDDTGKTVSVFDASVEAESFNYVLSSNTVTSVYWYAIGN